jgi:dihydroneopterin aldolase
MHYALKRGKGQSVVMSLRLFFDYSPATEDNDILDAAAKLA